MGATRSHPRRRLHAAAAQNKKLKATMAASSSTSTSRRSNDLYFYLFHKSLLLIRHGDRTFIIYSIILKSVALLSRRFDFNRRRCKGFSKTACACCPSQWLFLFQAGLLPPSPHASPPPRPRGHAAAAPCQRCAKSAQSQCRQLDSPALRQHRSQAAAQLQPATDAASPDSAGAPSQRIHCSGRPQYREQPSGIGFAQV